MSTDKDFYKKVFSESRMRRYFERHPEDEAKAIAHYKCNLRLSEAMYTSLSTLEVTLRNALNNELIRMTGQEDWYTVLSKIPDLRSMIRYISQAEKQISARNETITPSKIVAELTLGFWVSLLNSEYERFLWKDLRRSFPFMPKKIRQRKNISAPLNRFRQIRNRVFHNEPICWNIDRVKNLHNEILTVLGWINPSMPTWLNEIDRFNEVSENIISILGSNTDNRQPKVSVIITTYNQEGTVGEAIESVINQKCPFDYEIIVGEDASTDGTRAVCERYAARYPDLIRLMPEAPNKGLIDNFYDCIEAARGEYITDCAGDDIWISDRKLQLMAALLDSNPEANVVFSDWMIHNVATGETRLASTLGNNLLGLRGIIPGEVILEKTLNHVDSLPYNLSASMYRRADVMDALSTRPDMVRNRDFGCEDVPLIAALAVRGGAICLDTPTLCYNILDGSISNSTDTARQVRFYAKSLNASATLGAFYSVPQQAMAEFFRAKSDYIISLAFNSGDDGLKRVVHDSLSEWILPLSLKSRLQLMAMENRALWSACRRIKSHLKPRLKP